MGHFYAHNLQVGRGGKGLALHGGGDNLGGHTTVPGAPGTTTGLGGCLALGCLGLLFRLLAENCLDPSPDKEGRVRVLQRRIDGLPPIERLRMLACRYPVLSIRLMISSTG